MSKISNIEQNTQVELHANLEIATPTPVLNDPFFPFRVGQAPDVAITYLNVGNIAASDTFLGAGLNVVPYPLSVEHEREVWNRSEVHKGMAVGGTVPPHSENRYNTVTAPALTREQFEGLNGGTLQLCSTASVLWKDKTGAYCRYSFMCFHREPGFTPPIFNWHIQGWSYNKEERCEYDIR